MASYTIDIMGFCAKAEVVPPMFGSDRYLNCMRPSGSVIRLQRNRFGNLQISISTQKFVNAHTFYPINIGKIRTNFIHEGRITVHMQAPPCDLILREGSPKDLAAFVNALHDIKNLGKTSSQQESDSSSQAQPKSDDVNNRCKQKKTTHVNGGPSESTTATGSKAKKPLGERETIPKIVSRKRDATAMPDSNVAEAFDGDQDQRKRQKTMIKPDLGPTATATSSNGANKKQRIRLDLTKPKVESDQQVVNRMLRDSRLRPPVLKVTDRKDYPKTGFWSSLIKIEATGIQMKLIDYRMNPLEYLTFLNLSSNAISSIEPLKSLTSQLTTLILDSNPIEFISADFFLARPFPSLTHISFRSLGLKVLPRSIVNLEKLGALFLSHNSLEALPYNMDLMRSLTRLQVDYNKLKFLPISIGSLSLETLDISSNDFEKANARPQKIGNGSFPTLLELAAETLKTYNTRMVRLGHHHNIIKTTPEDIPQTLRDMLEGLKCCYRCRRMVSRYTLLSFGLARGSLANTIIYDHSGFSIPAKGVVCDKCHAREP